MVNAIVLRWIATGIALLGSMLSFTILLSRYNGSADKEFPILLAEYFEVNPTRNERIIESREPGPNGEISAFDKTIEGTAAQFLTVWQGVEELSSLLTLDKATLTQLTQSPDEQTRKTAGAILTITPTLIQSGPVGRSFDIYRADFQKIIGAGPLAAYKYDAASLESQKQYFGLESTLGFFEQYAAITDPSLVDQKNALSKTAATVLVNEGAKKADRIFEKLRIQTRVAVAAAVVVILASCIALTILIVDKPTYVIVFLHAAAFIGAVVFLAMIKANSDKNAELLRLAFSPVPAPNPGPAVYGAGFSIATALIGGALSALYVRMSGHVQEEDEENDMAMEEAKADEAAKADL